MYSRNIPENFGNIAYFWLIFAFSDNETHIFWSFKFHLNLFMYAIPIERNLHKYARNVPIFGPINSGNFEGNLEKRCAFAKWNEFDFSSVSIISEKDVLN